VAVYPTVLVEVVLVEHLMTTEQYALLKSRYFAFRDGGVQFLLELYLWGENQHLYSAAALVAKLLLDHLRL
jgi:hypothetical protein